MPTRELIAALIFVGIIFTVYSLELVMLSVFAYRKLRSKKAGGILGRKFEMAVHFMAVVGVFCFLYGYFVEPYWIEVNTIPIETEKLTSASFRLVHISDMHCERKMRNEERLIELVNSLQPDVVVFTGDTLNTSQALPLFKDTMRALKARLGKFAVRGNFDSVYLRYVDLYGGTGLELLDEKTISLEKNGERISLTGLSCDRPGRLKELLAGADGDQFNVFLHHYSDLVEDIGSLNVDLYLCGHTHGGQVALPIYGALITLSKFGKKYESGMYEVNDTILYVNRGIGLENSPAPKVRFAARPEITVFDIKPAGAD
jgi:predicted MPP superfamily phosphohydrolase